ncbi:MAG: NAD(P)-dependent oxidoreductase [Deltaproteobacteria bacterium]|nr:NAD(P)-dependent oxidoreductase [Deltaproteobacteria bacterium]
MNNTMALVTGAPGWLGTRFARTLAEGLPDTEQFKNGSPERLIRCLVLPDQDTGALEAIRGRIEIIRGDITSPETLKAFFQGAAGATLFHCAGIVHPNKGVKQFYSVNADGTRNLVEAAVSRGVRRMVHVSSNSPIGCNPSPDHRFDEASSYNPYMNYGKSKKLGEDIVHAVGKKNLIETVIIRPPWFYGPDQPPRQTLFFKMIRDGKAPIVGDGQNMRSMAYVDNICQGMLLSELVQEAAGKTYWIADERPYTMNEIVDTIEALLEKEFNQKCTHKRMRLPGLAGDVAQLADWSLQSAGVYNQKIHVLSEMNKSIACSVEMAKKELGYDPKISLEEGMRRSLRWVWDNLGPL